MNFKKYKSHYKTERQNFKENHKNMKSISKKFTGLLKVQNTFPIKDDLIHCSIVLYKKEDLSYPKDKIRNRSLLDNKSDIFCKKQKNKRNINIRININNNRKKFFKRKNEPLTYSTSEKKNFLKADKKKTSNLSDKFYKKIKRTKNKSVQYRSNNSINFQNDNLNITNIKNMPSFIKRNKNKRKEIILKKRKYGEIEIDSTNCKKNNEMDLKLELLDNSKDKSTKNKNNNIIIYNNIFKNRNNKYYNKIQKYKIDTSINKTVNLEINKKNSHSKPKNIENSKVNNNISNLSKRKNYIVPLIKVKKKKKEEKEKEIEDKNRNDSNIYNEENKQFFVSHLIESKQIEYLKDYEKYKIDFKDKILKNNEKKIKVINDEKLVEKILSSDEENKDTREDNEESDKKEIQENKEINLNKSNEIMNKKNNILKKIEEKNLKEKDENSQNKNNSKIINQYNNDIIKDSIDEGNNDEKNNIKITNNYNINNIENNNILIYNLRKPKINSLEYIYRINNNIDINKLITSLSCINLINNDINNINENDKNDIKNNGPESQSSVNVLKEKKNIRPKEQINDFMKNSRLKLKINEIKSKKDKKDEILKKFRNFIELQKNIEENKKLKLVNKSIRLNNYSLIKENNINMENAIKNINNEFPKSQKSSVSTTLNLQEFYLSIYDAQKIFLSKEKDRKLLKNNSMIICNDKNNNINNEYENSKINSGNFKLYNNIDNKNIISNKIKENGKKFNKNAIKKIKKVIKRLNNFFNENKNKNIYSKTNYIKDKKYLINDYDYILKNINKFLNKKKNSKNRKNGTKKAKNKNNDILSLRKQIPSNNKNFKKISMNEIKKIINHSQNNIHLNWHRHNKSNDNIAIESPIKDRKISKILIKNFSGIINKNKKYYFTDEQLNKYREIFNYIFVYIKLFIQKKIFNLITLYANIKNQYICGFNHFIIFAKKIPFNFLRIIQQRAYYQVILRQFYLPYLIRAFNKIQIYAISRQKYSDIDNIIKHIYLRIFLKRLLFFIELKENYINNNLEYDRIIEEEKDDISDSNENKYNKDNYNNKKENIKENSSFNSDNYENLIENKNEPEENENELYSQNGNIKNPNDDSLNKENTESYDEIKAITNTFNTIINAISHSPKIYIFNLFKKYYLDLKNKNIINDKKENINTFKENKNKSKFQLAIQKNEYSKDNKKNNKSELDNSLNSDLLNNGGEDIIYKEYKYYEQKNSYNNENVEENYIIHNRNDNSNNEKIIHENKINKTNDNKEEKEILYYKDQLINDSNKKDNKKNKESINLSNEENKKQEISLFIPYKGEIKKNLMSNLLNTNEKNSNNNSEYKHDINEDENISDRILKREFKKYEQKKNYHSINEKESNKIDKNKFSKQNKENDENNKYINNIDENIVVNHNIISSQEINIPIQKLDFIPLKQKNKSANNIEKSEKYNDVNYLYFNIKEKFGLKENDDNDNNKRYTESDDYIINDNLDENKKLLMNIPREIEQKITEELANEIINELFKIEIENKENLLTYKKNCSRPSNSSIIGVINKDSMSAISHSPGRKYNKTNSTQNLVNNNESYSSLNSNRLLEDDLNNSIFKKTVYEIKKEKVSNFYEKHIFPKLLNIIENNINKNYKNIINNLKIPLKKSDLEVMEDLSNLITHETLTNNSIIKYSPNFYNKDIIKNEYIDKKILDEFNQKLEDKIVFFRKYRFEYLNQCIYDTANEIIKNKRMYEKEGEPLLWSLRNRKLEYEYKDTKLFKQIFASNIINELKKLFFSKIGEVIENSENLDVSQFSKERDIKYNNDIREDLKKEKELDKLDEQETIIKISISKCIMNQLLNEVIEILEHIQYSRKQPEQYFYKSIFSCDDIPLLSFQKYSNKNDEEEEKYEDNINQ